MLIVLSLIYLISITYAYGIVSVKRDLVHVFKFYDILETLLLTHRESKL